METNEAEQLASSPSIGSTACLSSADVEAKALRNGATNDEKHCASAQECPNPALEPVGTASSTPPPPPQVTSHNQCFEYETQFLGFTPKSLGDGMYNAVLEYSYTCMVAAIEKIRLSCPDLVTDRDAASAKEVLLPELAAVMDKTFDKFESYIMKNILRIPEGVLLPEDSVHRSINYSQADEDELDRNIKHLEQQIECEKYMIAHMKSELMTCAQVQAMQDRFIGFLDDLDKKLSDAGIPNLKETLTTNKDKMAEIKDKLKKIQQYSLIKENIDTKIFPPEDTLR